MIGANIRKYRMQHEMTQEELARGICSVSQISKIENGQVSVRPAMLRELAHRLHVTVSHLEIEDARREEVADLMQRVRDCGSLDLFDQAIVYAKETVEKSRRYGYLDLLEDALDHQCRLHIANKEYGDAIEVAVRALETEEVMRPSHRLLLSIRVGEAYQALGDLHAALDWFLRADEFFEESAFEGNDEIRLRVAFSLGRCHYCLDNLTMGLRFATQAEELAQSLSKYIWKIRAATFRGMCLSKLHRFDEAEAVYLAALKEAEDNGFMLDVGILQQNLGCLYFRKGQLAQARILLERAQLVCVMLREDFRLADNHRFLAEIAFQEGSYDRCRHHVQAIQSIYEKCGDDTYREAARGLQVLGWVERECGQFAAYVANLERAFALAEQHRAYQIAYEIAVELARALDEQGEQQAIEWYRRAIACSRKQEAV